MTKLAFLSDWNAEDVREFSGTPYNMLRGLRASFEHVEFLRTPGYKPGTGPIKDKLAELGAQATELLRGVNADAILCCGNAVIPYLETELPIFQWHDSTWSILFRGMLGPPLMFDGFRKRQPELHSWDKAVLERCRVSMFSSHWCAELAKKHYGLEDDRVEVVRYGGNMAGVGDAQGASAAASARSADVCRLLFVGSDWRRKDIVAAIELTELLRSEHIDARLTVIGCHRHKHTAAESLDLARESSAPLNFVGFVSKHESGGLAFIDHAFRTSHFFVHPAVYDCSPIVVNEACSYALPVLARLGEGGLASLVEPGVNGFLYDRATDFAREAANTVHRLMGPNRGAYLDLARSTFEVYEERLNWQRNCERVHEIITAAI